MPYVPGDTPEGHQRAWRPYLERETGRFVRARQARDQLWLVRYEDNRVVDVTTDDFYSHYEPQA